MPGGRFDSSKTRVQPVFDYLMTLGRQWVPRLLRLADRGCGSVANTDDLTLLEGYWQPQERCLPPPVSLLSWCVRNASRLGPGAFADDRRRRLAEGDPDLIEEALKLLRTENAPRGWYLFEGPTCPDALLVTRDALVVIEGKRTEAGATTETTWLPGRHQLWRHIDAAWEIRGRRSVYGLFIVESAAEAAIATVPEPWLRDAESCMQPEVLQSSFPHRSKQETDAIARCYLGITTWRHVCDAVGYDWRTLPHDVSGVAP